MDAFAKKPFEERRAVFTEGASRRDILPVVIEKDFWVCWTLRRLFSSPQTAPYLTFKGGTSLSKAYDLIERFSEDIDLTISPDAPFLAEGKSPMEEGLSGKERRRRMDALKLNAQQFVANTAQASLKEAISAALGQQGDWQLDLDSGDQDQQTILFQYPRTTTETSYIKPTIKLEFGARGGTEPQKQVAITPYIAQDFPKLFQQPDCVLTVLSVTRSFWEKATILHALFHGSKLRGGMSRHYYDTFVMDQKGIATEALADTSLLNQVVQNKSLLFKDSRASYETAEIGTLRLVPEGEVLQSLQKDYKAMHEMFMNTPPKFEKILEGLALLEKRINKA